MKSAEEVIKEIDDLIEDSDEEDQDVSEHGNQVGGADGPLEFHEDAPNQRYLT